MTSSALVSRTLGDWLSLMVLVVCWGSAIALSKVAVETITPMWTVALRLWIAGPLVLLLLYWRGERLPAPGRIWIWLTAIAVVSIVPFYLISWGALRVDVNLAGILIGVIPLFVVLLSYFLVSSEHLTILRTAGVALGFLGVVVLIGPGALSGLGGGSAEVWGQLAILGAAWCYAVQGILARVMPDASPFQKTAGALTVAIFLATPLAAMLEPGGLDDASIRSVVATATIALTATGLAGIVMFYLTTRAGPTFVALSSYLIPVYAMMLGVVAFGEAVRPDALLALALILLGILLSEVRLRRRG